MSTVEKAINTAGNIISTVGGYHQYSGDIISMVGEISS